MSLIEKRALQIVYGEKPIVHVGGDVYEVPSESLAGHHYVVNIARRTCECPAWKKTKYCKHIRAAVLEREKRRPSADGILPTIPNPYRQPPWYEEIKKREEVAVMEMLRCLGIAEPYAGSGKRGRPAACVGDLMFCAVAAAYRNRPTLKAIADPELLVERGYLQRLPPQPSTYKEHMRNPALAQALWRAQSRIVDCVRKVETQFVVDSTYIKTPNSVIVVELNGPKIKMRTAKVHFASGLRTLVAMGVYIVEENENDQLGFLKVMDQFWSRVFVEDVYADAGYNNADHFEAVHARGGRAWINFTEDRGPQAGKPHFNEMLEMHETNLDAWLARYHMRNLSETNNSSFKRTVKRLLRSRRVDCIKTELLAATISFNLCRLHVARKAFGIDLPFATSARCASSTASPDRPRRCGWRRSNVRSRP